MTDEEIPEDVRVFLHEHLEDYEQLVVLVLLVGHPAEAWDGQRAAGKVRLPEEEAAHALEELCAKGFARVEITNGVRAFTYAAHAPVSKTIERLARLYASQPLEIMRLLNANAIERVRTSMARSFASAFIVGRKK